MLRRNKSRQKSNTMNNEWKNKRRGMTFGKTDKDKESYRTAY